MGVDHAAFDEDFSLEYQAFLDAFQIVDTDAPLYDDPSPTAFFAAPNHTVVASTSSVATAPHVVFSSAACASPANRFGTGVVPSPRVRNVVGYSAPPAS